MTQREYLRTWRLSRGWTQREAAHQLGMHEKGYQKLELGERRLSGQTKRLIELLDKRA